MRPLIFVKAIALEIPLPACGCRRLAAFSVSETVDDLCEEEGGDTGNSGEGHGGLDTGGTVGNLRREGGGGDVLGGAGSWLGSTWDGSSWGHDNGGRDGGLNTSSWGGDSDGAGDGLWDADLRSWDNWGRGGLNDSWDGGGWDSGDAAVAVAGDGGHDGG